MTRLTALLLFLFAALSSSAQELTVKSLHADPMDLSAATKPESDLNGKACALVKVRIAADGVTFEGNIIKSGKNNASEYWVYMTEGTYMLTVSCPGYLPLVGYDRQRHLR